MKPNKDTKPEQRLPDTEKTLFETARELEEKQRQRQAENEQRIRAQEEKERNEYAKKLHQERIELIRLKQGLAADKSQDVQPDSPPKYTFREKLSNFIYHNKWWLGIAVFSVALVSYLIYDLVTRVTPDLTVMLLSYGELGSYTQNIAEIFEECTEDINGDGKVYVQVLYLPCSEEFDQNATMDYAMSITTKMNVEFQSGTSAIIISDKAADEKLDINLLMDDLSSGDIPADNGKYYLDDTSFAEKISYEGELPDGLYIGLRAPFHEASYADTLLKTIENSKPVLNKLIEIIS